MCLLDSEFLGGSPGEMETATQVRQKSETGQGALSSVSRLAESQDCPEVSVLVTATAGQESFTALHGEQGAKSDQIAKNSSWDLQHSMRLALQFDKIQGYPANLQAPPRASVTHRMERGVGGLPAWAARPNGSLLGFVL